MPTSEISAITASTAARVSCAAPTPGVVAAASTVSPHVEYASHRRARVVVASLSSSSDRADRVYLPPARFAPPEARAWAPLPIAAR